MHLLHWEAMREFRKLGVRRFDFQGVRVNPEKGSKQEGILSYKKGFGGQLVQGYLWKHALRPLKGMAYSLAARLLQGGDIVDREQHKLQAELSR
jgi:lipid II:glycine glycyltransferase (peptidoglycan interpeptide bridge formation enzyme)